MDASKHVLSVFSCSGVLGETRRRGMEPNVDGNALELVPSFRDEIKQILETVKT